MCSICAYNSETMHDVLSIPNVAIVKFAGNGPKTRSSPPRLRISLTLLDNTRLREPRYCGKRERHPNANSSFSWCCVTELPS